jgi:hypothetical protein
LQDECSVTGYIGELPDASRKSQNKHLARGGLRVQASRGRPKQKPPAPHARRGLALFADVAIVVFVAFAVTSAFKIPRLIAPIFDLSFPQIASRWFVLFGALYFLAYETSCIWLTQRTPGKAMFNLRIRRTGHRSDLLWALGRSLFGYIVVDVFGVGALVALWDDRHRCVHDLVFRSEVILESGGPITPKGLWIGLIGFEEERKQAIDEKTKSFQVFKGFVKYLIRLGSPLTLLFLFTRKAPVALPGSADTSTSQHIRARRRRALGRHRMGGWHLVRLPVGVVPAITAAVVVVVVASVFVVRAATHHVAVTAHKSPSEVVATESSSPTALAVVTTPATLAPVATPVPTTSAPPRPSPAPPAARPTALQFDSVNLPGAAQDKTVSLTNHGSSAMVLSSPSIAGPNAPDFSITSDTCSSGNLAPAAVCAVGVGFTPLATGPRTAYLLITRNGTGKPLTVQLSGSGADPPVGVAPSSGQGYWVVSSNGSVTAHGDAPFLGSPTLKPGDPPIVGIAAASGPSGYWLVNTAGAVFAFGNAAVLSPSATGLGHVKGIVALPGGGGYWLFDSNGHVAAFGKAQLWGSLASVALASPVVGMSAKPDGQGYWLVGGDGLVYTYGRAAFYGSLSNAPPPSRIVSIVSTPTGNGYVLVSENGPPYYFGDAQQQEPSPQPIPNTVEATGLPSSAGYLVLTSDGLVTARTPTP